jgi:molybdopterin synthase catalytic subunit
MISKKSIIFKAVKMIVKYFLKHRLPFWYDLIFVNPERISSIRLKTTN